MQEDIYQRLTKVETKIEEHSLLLLKQQEKNELQTELNTILKLNAEQMKKFGETLERVDTSLNNLHSQQQQLGTRMTEIEGFLSNQKFSVTDVLKYIGAIVGGLVVGYIATLIGK